MEKDILRAVLVKDGLLQKYADYLGGNDAVEKRISQLAGDIVDDTDLEYVVKSIRSNVEKSFRKDAAKKRNTFCVTPLWISGVADGSVEWWINYNPSDDSYTFESESGYTARDIAKALRDLANKIYAL